VWRHVWSELQSKQKSAFTFTPKHAITLAQAPSTRLPLLRSCICIFLGPSSDLDPEREITKTRTPAEPVHMTKTHWKTLPPWEELCAEILAEMEADALSPPDNVPSDPVMRKAFDDWDRRGRLIPWRPEMPELAIDEEERDDAAGDQPLDLDGIIDRAMDPLKMGCSMPSCQISSKRDLTTTPTALRNGKSGGIRLWSYQLAAVGRMERMLEEQDCAVLASLRSVSYVAQRSLYLLTRTSTPLADRYNEPGGRRRRGTILVMVPLALMSNWYWVCVYCKSSLRCFSSKVTDEISR
jgi:hypothetical protein